MSPRDTLSPLNDAVFKMLFARTSAREGLVNLLSDVLRPSAPIRSVEVLNPALEPTHVADKAMVLDVLARLSDGRTVNVEMQTWPHPGFRKRVLQYWSRVYASQLTRGGDYEPLPPVVSIVFMAFVEPDSPRFHRVVELRDQDRVPYTDALRLHLIALPNLHRALGEDQRPMVAWANFLAATTAEEVEAALMSNPGLKPAQETLQAISADEQARWLAEERERALAGWRIAMGETRAEGRAEGRLEGRLEGGREVVERLLALKFGPLPDAVLARVREASHAELERLSTGLIVASSLDQLMNASA
jgi:predicted transposase/invertase (TIGR01784 family)